MNLFITVHDREKDIDIELNMSTVESYEEATVVDMDESQHICIIYRISNGIRIIEEFSSDSDRESKMAELDEYLA